MANLDLGHDGGKPSNLAQDAHQEVQRTQVMLVVTAAASVSIIVVAALFMSLF